MSERGSRVAIHCPCGNVFSVPPSKSERARYCSKSCLYLYRTQPPRTHGVAAGDRTIYNMWTAMVRRCSNPSSPGYENYGGRGVSIHPDWIGDPVAFRDWLAANLGPRPAQHTLDRINVDGNYEPGNLRWADRSTQSWNRRSKSGLMGVSLTASTGRWRAQIMRHGKYTHLGYFSTEEEASAAYLAAGKEMES